MEAIAGKDGQTSDRHRPFKQTDKLDRRTNFRQTDKLQTDGQLDR